MDHGDSIDAAPQAVTVVVPERRPRLTLVVSLDMVEMLSPVLSIVAVVGAQSSHTREAAEELAGLHRYV